MQTVKKISLWSFILPTMYPFFLFFFFFLVGLKLLVIFIIENNSLAITISFSFFLFIIIPPLILQFYYYKIDRNKVLIIDDTTNEVKIIDKETEFIFRLDEIDRVRIITSKDYDLVYRMLMPWRTYYYYMICLKNDDEFLVTRFIARKLEKILNVRIVYKRVFFPFISKAVLMKAKNGITNINNG